MKRLLCALLVTLGMLVLGAAVFAQDDGASDGAAATPDAEQDLPASATSIANVLRERDDTSIFVDLMDSTGMMDQLEEPGVYTLFVPVDEAFEALPPDVFAELRSNVGMIEWVLRNHLAMGGSSAEVLVNMHTFSNIEGYQLFVTRDRGEVYVNEAQILVQDLEAANGVVHLIDTVLVQEPRFPRENQPTIPEGETTGDPED